MRDFAPSPTDAASENFAGVLVLSADSMGNTEVLKRGDLQMTSAGTGIRHSEKCHGSEQVHFLQIWAIPSKSNLTPQYYTRFVFLCFPITPSAAFLIGALTDQNATFVSIQAFLG